MTSPMPEDRAAPVRVSELLHLPLLAGAQLLGGKARMAAVVSSVTLVDRIDARHDAAPGAALVLAGEAGTGGWAVEIGLRAAWQRAVSCVIVPSEGSEGSANAANSTEAWEPAGAFAASTVSLADRLGVPLIAVPLKDPVEFVVGLTMLVMRPLGTRSYVVAAVAREISAAPREPGPLLEVLDRHLPVTQVALLARDGTVLAGRAPVAERADALAGALASLTQGRHLVAGWWMVVQPVHGSDERAGLYLVASMPQRVDAWGDVVADALAVATGPLAAWVAGERLAAERDARLRGALLTELLDDTEVAGRHAALRAARLGWRLDGWHTGVHVTLVGHTDPQALPFRTSALEAALADAGLRGPVVERAEGWSLWIDHDEEPSAQVTEWITDRLRRALEARPADLMLAAGVGTPGYDMVGLRSSLVSARDAALLAVTAGADTVEQSRELGLRQLLITPLASGGFRALASRLLEPLASGDDDGLLETFTVYLDSGCSSSDTATRLRVHRNTVTRRVERAADLLRIDLNDAEERLAAHLACHALRAIRNG